MWLCEVSTITVLLCSTSIRTAGASLDCDIVMVVSSGEICLLESPCVLFCDGKEEVEYREVEFMSALALYEAQPTASCRMHYLIISRHKLDRCIPGEVHPIRMSTFCAFCGGSCFEM
jgi:hypothetical protein